VVLLLEKIAQAELGHGHAVGLERFPNQLAPDPDSGIVVA